MQKQMNGLWFRLMSLEYRMKTSEVAQTLVNAGIQAGMSVLDFGCGPGRYTLPAADLVGTAGAVYAVDVHPLAMKIVEREANRANLTNVQVIRTDCATGLPSGSVDVVLLYDALHDVEDKFAVVKELRRVLKQDGRLQYKDHSFFGDQLVALMNSSGLCTTDQTAQQIAFRKC